VRFLAVFVALAVLLTGVAVSLDQGSESRPVTLTFVGDIMLGRSVAPVAAADPDGLFRDVRHVLRGSDLTLGNLESPLTTRSQVSPNPNVLIADPETAGLLTGAGFDVISLANNHIGDAGPEGVTDTLDAVASSRLVAVGAGPNSAVAGAPTELTVEGVRIAILAFDATGAGLVAGVSAGVVPWDPEAARIAVEAATASADLVVVSVHGGVEYLPESDPRILRIADLLVSWGVDVVWGHGPHVPQPIFSAEHAGRVAVIATSLGNFLFDQRGPSTGGGTVLQVLADRHGVIAHRSGVTSHHDLRVHFTGWDLPKGDAVLLNGSWWELKRHPLLVSGPSSLRPKPFPWGEALAAGMGPLTGDHTELVVSYRARSGSHPVRDGLPDVTWTDSDGYTMHLGIFRADDLAPVWQAGMVPAPIAALAVCDGSLSLAYRTLDSPTVRSTGAAVWRTAGLAAADFLPGPGTPACGDADLDGISDPLVLERPSTSDIWP
jgi:poly-gamma-glutamate capsule biosynthesis protein CapA/YwtB (metallophosphatase superfamily)